MLKSLFGSKIRAQLLRLFLANENNKYYIRELERLLETQINAVRRELENLIELNIIEEVVEKKSEKIKEKETSNLSNDTPLSGGQPKKFFRVNKKFVLYSELKNFILKAYATLDGSIKKAAEKSGKINFLTLSGIFRADSSAPTDILLVGKVDIKKFKKFILNCEKDWLIPIRYTIMDEEEFLYRKSMGDKFLFGILDSEKIVLIDRLENKNN